MLIVNDDMTEALLSPGAVRR